MKSLEIVKNKLKKYVFYYTGVKYFIENLNEEEIHNLKQDLEVLNILKKHIELEKEDSDPNDEYALQEDVLYMDINLEQDISSDEYQIIKQWLEDKQ